MKLKNYLLLAGSSIIMASCAEDSLEQIQQELHMVTLSASIESNATRASFDDNGKLAWSKGDAIWVQTSKGSAYFNLNEEGVGQASGTFSGALNGDETLGTIAVYPYNANHNASDNNNINVALPDSYRGITDFENANAIMLATDGSNGSYSFKHLGGMLRFKISNFPQGATQAVLTTGNAISGSFAVTQNEDNAYVVTSSASDENNSVTLNFTATAQVEAKSITFPLPTGSYTGVKLEIKDATDKVLAVYNNPAKAYTIKRANRYNASITFTSIEAGSGEESISTVYAKTEEELREAFTNGYNIVLEADIALSGDGESLAISSGADVILDLNGKVISRTSDTPVSMITNNGNLTIKDSGNSGRIAFTFNGTVDNSVAANAIGNSGRLIVEGGKVSNTGTGAQIGYAIDNYNGATLQVNGGTIAASGSSYYDGIRLFCGSDATTVTVDNGMISTIWAQNPTDGKKGEVNGTVIINGGTVGTVYYENYTQVKVKSGVTTTVNSYGNGSDYTYEAEEDGYIVYSFLPTAYAATEDELRTAFTQGVTVVLEADVTLSSDAGSLTVPSGVAVTLVLNGKTISQEKACTESYSMISNNGTLTIDGEGTISFNDTGDGDAEFGWGSYTIASNGTLVVNGGTIQHLGKQNTSTEVKHMYCAIHQWANTAVTTINGGKISNPTYRSIRINSGTLNILGGEMEGQVWIQASYDNNAALKIENGEFAPCGVDGSSVYIENTSYEVTLSVTGGTFNTKIGCADASKSGVAGKVSGGIFTEAAKTYTSENLIASNKQFVSNGDGTYTLQ